MILCFQLTMPNKGSWNGKWSGEDKKFYAIRKVSKTFFDKQQHFKRVAEQGRDNWHYSWNDGWGANVSVEIVDGKEAAKRRKASAGFCGYEWMIDSIMWYGIITTERERKVLSA